MKMDKLIVIVFMIRLWSLTACSNDSGDNGLPPPEGTVSLEGAIGQSTRAVIGSGYEKDLLVCFARQDETGVSSGQYGTWSVHQATRSGGKGNRPIVFADVQSYPVDGRHIRLCGYYPPGGEQQGNNPVVNTGAGKVTFMVDGTTDIMATGMLTASGYAPAQTCTFRHLLTQVRLVCYSDRTAQWGSIKTIEAVDVHMLQALDLEQETPKLDDTSSGDEIKNILVQDIINLPVPEATADEDIPEPQGYLLFPVSPVDGTEEHPLHFRITTTKDGKGTDSETLWDVSVHVEGGFQTGKSHVISLFFTDNSKIQTTSVRVETWTDCEQPDIPI